MKNRFLEISLLIGQLKNQLILWSLKTRWSIRFLLCGFTTFIAFTILNGLGSSLIGKHDEIIIAGIENPKSIPFIFIAIFWGYTGLWFSLASAALFSSLLPKE